MDAALMQIQFTPEKINAFWAKVRILDDPNSCWEWAGFKRGTYGGFSLPAGNVLAHRVAYLLTKGTLPDDKMVLHSCDNRICCQPAHLSLGTALDNARDCTTRKRHSARKWSEEDVLLVRKLILFGLQPKDVSDVTGIHPDGVRRMSCDTNAWKHVQRPIVISLFERYPNEVPPDRNAKKLCDADIPRIRSLKGSKFAWQVGEAFGVSENAILQVWRGNSWRHVQ